MNNEVTSVCIYADQFKKIKDTGAIISEVINSAIKRFAKGELTVDFTKFTKGERPTHNVAVRKNILHNCSGEQIRQILDAHLQNPRDYTSEIKRLDREIDALMGSFKKVKYIEVKEKHK